MRRQVNARINCSARTGHPSHNRSMRDSSPSGRPRSPIGNHAPLRLDVAELLVRFLKHARTYYRDPESGEPTKGYDEFDRTSITLTDTYIPAFGRQGVWTRPPENRPGPNDRSQLVPEHGQPAGAT